MGSMMKPLSNLTWPGCSFQGKIDRALSGGIGNIKIYEFWPLRSEVRGPDPISYKNASSIVPYRAGSHIESMLEGVAPYSLNITPWGAMGGPFMPNFIDFRV